MTSTPLRTVDEAIAIILAEVELRSVVSVPLDEARGLVLASDVVSEIDSPPFDKSQMDGFAVRAADVASAPVTLNVIETVMAGQTPRLPLGSGQATQIMTGAPLPVEADAVVPIERCDFTQGAETVFVRQSAESGTFIIRRGSSMSVGETVLDMGTRIDPPQIGLLAELGHADVAVWPRPTVGILATGDELVPIGESPGPGQIRNSNQTMLAAQVARMGADPLRLGIARDEREHLRSKIAAGLECDIVCLSGGVSMGTLDLVPSELEAVGVREVFHKVAMKPGKPVWFGRLDAANAPDGRPRWIFALPGNPVSSMVCCELFVRTAIRKLMGLAPAGPTAIEARLQVEHTMRGDRQTYFPARLSWSADGPVVRPLNWRGSFDLRATADANAMILFIPGTRTYAAGERVPVYEW